MRNYGAYDFDECLSQRFSVSLLLNDYINIEAEEMEKDINKNKK